MKLLFIILVFIAPVFCLAQDPSVSEMKKMSERTIKKDSDDTLKKQWKKGGLYSLNISQSSLSNWAAGGEDFTFSVNSLLSLYAFYKKEKHSWDNTFDFNLGYVNTTSLGSRKNDDRFDLLSKYGYAIFPKINIAGLVNLRSQFFKGYTYSNNLKTLSSAFMSPGNLLLSAGLDYNPMIICPSSFPRPLPAGLL